MVPWYVFLRPSSNLSIRKLQDVMGVMQTCKLGISIPKASPVTTAIYITVEFHQIFLRRFDDLNTVSEIYSCLIAPENEPTMVVGVSDHGNWVDRLALSWRPIGQS